MTENFVTQTIGFRKTDLVVRVRCIDLLYDIYSQIDIAVFSGNEAIKTGCDVN